MSSYLYGLLIFAFLAFSLYSNVDVNNTTAERRDILFALDTAAAAGATKFDRESTAEAGIVILDEEEVYPTVREIFSQNTSLINDIEPSSLYIEVINDAPTTRIIGDVEQDFKTNAVVVGYGAHYQIVEVDDQEE